VDIEERGRVRPLLQANDLAAGERSAVAHRSNLTRVDSAGAGAQDSCALPIVSRAAQEDYVEGFVFVVLRLVRGHLRAY
jgi:hypothetical protein